MNYGMSSPFDTCPLTIFKFSFFKFYYLLQTLHTIIMSRSD